MANLVLSLLLLFDFLLILRCSISLGVQCCFSVLLYDRKTIYISTAAGLDRLLAHRTGDSALLEPAQHTISLLKPAREFRGSSDLALLKEQCQLRDISFHIQFKGKVNQKEKCRQLFVLCMTWDENQRAHAPAESTNLAGEQVDALIKLESHSSRELKPQASRIGTQVKLNGPDATPPSQKRKYHEIDGKTAVSRCTCDPAVDQELRRNMDNQDQNIKSKALKKILAGIVESGNEGYLVCYHHVRKVGGTLLGLRIKGFDQQELTARLVYLYHEFADLDEIKEDDDTHTWFRQGRRPAHEWDERAVYRFNPIKPKTFTFDWKSILDSISPDILPTWERDGNVILDGFFTWWWNIPADESMKSIGKILAIEFEMYQHHIRRSNDNSNLGWARNQLYSVGQQLMRQDPFYYILYACLRPDKQWRLISYPYYAKNAIPGDSTGFRHLDVNLPLLARKQHGINMIQGSVSITDEEPDDCTEIVPGMHRYTKQWHERVEKRGIELAGEVIRVEGRVLTKGDLAEFNTDWTPVPCKKGGVRVTQPSIPHGALGPCKRPRQTMLPWLVEIKENHVELEIAASGSWSKIAAASTNKVAPPSTPSGLSNNYKRIPYAFPAHVNVGGLGALSDALVGRVRWTDAGVIAERNIMLGDDRHKAMAFVERWRKRAVIQANEAFEHSVQAEKEAFGDKSYFLRKEQGRLDEPIVEDPLPKKQKGGRIGDYYKGQEFV